MKYKRWKIFVAVLSILALMLGCCAGVFAAGGDYRYTSGKDGLILTAYTGAASNLTIPAEIDGKPVTEIGDGCFQGMVCLKRVHVPEGVTRIGDYAFECCSALERIYLPDSLREIGDGAFSGCGRLTLADLQDNVERIGRGAFLCCDALVSIVLPAALEELGDFAFAGCGSLASAAFSGGKLKAVPDRAFYGCEALTRIRLPESVSSIGKRAFSGCKSLHAFYHGTALNAIGSYAFESCEQMASADFTAPVIPTGVLSGCGAVNYFAIHEGTKTIEPKAFFGSGLTDLTIAGTVTDIAPGAFYGSSIASVSLEENDAYQVKDGALLTADGKTMLFWMPEDPYAEEPQTDFTVPDGVEIIESYAFAACPLAAIQLPDSLKEIRAYAFAETDIQEMKIPEGVKVDPKAYGDAEAEAEALAAVLAADDGVETQSAAGDKSLYREEDYKDFRVISNEEFDSWSADYLAYNEKQGNPLSMDLIPYIMRYKGEVIPHFMAMTAVQNHDPEMWVNAENFFGDDFEQMYLMMNHGLFTELHRGKMQDDLILYSGVYDSQLMAAAGTDTVPTRAQLIDAIGREFTDPVMISTTPDAAVACGFGDTLFIIYASREAMEAQGAVNIDAVAHSSENEILMSANARYRVLDVGDMTVTHQDPWEEEPVTEARNYVRVELLSPEAPANPFVDVAEGQYFYDAVLWAVKNHITTGIDAAHFSPGGDASRAQIVTFLWRAAGMPEPKSTDNPFADVAKDAFYYKAVLWALENGITTGIDKTHFAPGRVCTRGEFVTLLYRANGSEKVEVKNPFTDVTRGSFCYNAVLWALEKGITRGTDDTHFSPMNRCTRGETVTFLYRAN